MISKENNCCFRPVLTDYSQVALKSDSDLAELGGKGYVKFDLSAREFDLCARGKGKNPNSYSRDSDLLKSRLRSHFGPKIFELSARKVRIHRESTTF